MNALASVAMRQLRDTPLVAASAYLDRPAVLDGARVWTWRQVHAASLALVARLNGAATLCNLCDTRIGFLVAWLAALRSGCMQVLPASGGHADLLAMLNSSVGPVIVSDNAEALQSRWAEHARCIVHVPESSSAQIPDHDLAWSPVWDVPLVCLYTSGSTGTPEPQLKTLDQLARGAQVLGVRLGQDIDGGLPALRRIVCSVPPQHMFGVETSVMLPLMHGIPVIDRRPLLPADVRSTLEGCEEGAAWVATPLHLRSLVRAGDAVPNCRVVVASTMPLAPTLAMQAEALVDSPVLEIYGSTETGAVAMRRTAHTVKWHALPGVWLEPAAQGTLISGSHFPSPRLLPDHIEPDPTGGFDLLGREGDLIKIAGRRASLSGLNLMLQEMPGMADGVFYLPAAGAPTERLVLIHTGAPLDRAATEAWLRERMDPVFLPRTIIRVDHLPRTGTGKLPRAALDEVFAGWLARRSMQ